MFIFIFGVRFSHGNICAGSYVFCIESNLHGDGSNYIGRFADQSSFDVSKFKPSIFLFREGEPPVAPRRASKISQLVTKVRGTRAVRKWRLNDGKGDFKHDFSGDLQEGQTSKLVVLTREVWNGLLRVVMEGVNALLDSRMVSFK